jgi:hypothetical protein
MSLDLQRVGSEFPSGALSKITTGDCFPYSCSSRHKSRKSRPSLGICKFREFIFRRFILHAMIVQLHILPHDKPFREKRVLIPRIFEGSPCVRLVREALSGGRSSSGAGTNARNLEIPNGDCNGGKMRTELASYERTAGPLP